MESLITAFSTGMIPLQPVWKPPPITLQHSQYSFLLSNYHEQASAAVCILSLMSKSSSQIWLELGRRNMTTEIIFPDVHQKHLLLKEIQNCLKTWKRKEGKCIKEIKVRGVLKGGSEEESATSSGTSRAKC